MENIPRLTNPYFDCVINAFTNLNRYIQTYLDSADKITKNIYNTVYTFDKLVTKAARLGENISDSLGFTDSENDISELKAKIEYLNATLLEADFSNKEINNSFNEFVSNFVADNAQRVSSLLQNKNTNALLIAFANYCIQKERIIVSANDNKAYAVSIRELQSYLEQADYGGTVSLLSYTDLKNIV